MTRKDYELIASAIKRSHLTELDGHEETIIATAQHKTTAFSVARRLEMDNPRFDRDRFLKACGVES